MTPEVGSWLRQKAADRHHRLDTRLAQISGMRDLPGAEAIVIGSARDTTGAVLFADLVGSTQLATRYQAEPEKMLLTLNILIPALMDSAKVYSGEFEKNTGDGIMAYFGLGSSNSDTEAATNAAAAADAMLWAVANIVNPELANRALRAVRIRIGADVGQILVARIGLHRTPNGAPIVAVGLAANRAAKIQATALRNVDPGDARVGEDLFRALPLEWRRRFALVDTSQMSWPFTKPKTPQQVADERRQLEEERLRREQELWNSAGISMPAFPSVAQWTPGVNPNRPYRLYRLRTPRQG